MSLTVRARMRRAGLDMHIHVDLPTEGVTAVFGRSGCGKTSLLRIIAGLDRVPGAEVCFDDQTWQGLNASIPLEKRRIGLVFQESSLLPHLGVRDNLLYGYQRTPDSQRRHRPEAIIDLLGLGTLIERRIDQLSGGQRQRIALGRALLASPQLLLLDEPLSALDSQSKREIMPFLDRLSGEIGVPIIYVSHAAAEIERLADHVALMERGRIESVEPIQQALSRPDSPLFADEGPASVLMGTLQASDAPDLQMFRSGALTLRLALPNPVQAGPTTVRLRIGARDVSLAIEPTTGISILNQLPFTIEAVHARDERRVIIRGRLVSGDLLLAEVSGWSARELLLQPGKRVFALVKAVSLLD
ncbi:molybdate transport system ATP-binding protein [Halopseudomonas xinjiangensis]|uniref:Molybdate transport system ATP-binding protein n=1 Tax=Halopseudomonas xinjiangensis TaxID=487184 RepID=A0A1H1N686_9GAMM|nr:molybdenum ABC transporter ATP-binding protein [Halopseudomonas xinjiangensis]SDR94553.1 molybdate transport system ATP-binding protein [Halopseudomonas xinjiangensis]